MKKFKKPSRAEISFPHRPHWAEISFPQNLNEPILDIACGFSNRREQFSNKKYISLDISREVKPDVIGDAHFLPFRNNSISTVLCIAALEHVKYPETVVREIYRILNNEGISYVNVPFLYFVHDQSDYYRYTEEGLKVLLKDFKIKNARKLYSGIISTVISWILPMTYTIPFPIKNIIQKFLYLIFIITKKFDIGKERFYATLLFEIQK